MSPQPEVIVKLLPMTPGLQHVNRECVAADGTGVRLGVIPRDAMTALDEALRLHLAV